MSQPRVWNYQELMQRRHRGRLLGWLALAAFIVLALVVSRLLYLSGTVRVTVASGKTEGTVHQFLLSVAQNSAANDLDIEPVIANGTIDMLNQVDAGRIDFAIVHGGSDMDHFRNVRQVGAISVGAIHLLVKRELHPAVLDDLQNLRGKSINLGLGKNTVMYQLSQEILSFVGLGPGDYRPLVMSFEELSTEKHRERLPDAVFISAMPPSDLVRRLVVQFDYRLVGLPFGDAFRLTALHHSANSGPHEGIRREHIIDATIPAYAYEASPAVPPQAIATLGLRVIMVTHVRMHRATVVKLLDRIIGSRFAEAMQPSLDASIVRQHAELPWHPGALDYRRRDEPLITGEGLGVISNALQVCLPAGGAILLLWGWLRNRVLIHRELRFDRFIALVSGVEKRALELEYQGTPDRQAIHLLHHELCTIKDAALERIAVGEASDESLVTSLFAHIADVRAFCLIWNGRG